jgi:tetratricopeptide (TPR) repeat protein
LTATDESREHASDPVEPVSPLRSGQHLDKLAELEEERRYLLASLRDLEREHEVGDVDDEDYETLKDGYTVRAAAVLRQLDDGRRQLPPKRARNWKRSAAIVVAVAAVTVAIGVALGAAFGERGVNEEITGFSPADAMRSTLVDARAALNRGDFQLARDLYLEVNQNAIERGEDNVEALAYLGWSEALVARQESGSNLIDDDRLSIARLALDAAIEVDPTYADPHCYSAIIEFSFRGDAEAALPFVEACEANDPPAEVAQLVSSFADEIRAAVDG